MKENNKKIKSHSLEKKDFNLNPRKIKHPKDPVSKKKKQENLAEALRLNLLRRKEKA